MLFFFFSSRRRHTRWNCDWSSDVCSSDLTSRLVFVQEADHGVAPKPAAIGREDVPCELAQVLPEPPSERDAEAGLAALRDLGRELGGERSPECHLALAATRLEP